MEFLKLNTIFVTSYNQKSGLNSLIEKMKESFLKKISRKEKGEAKKETKTTQKRG